VIKGTALALVELGPDSLSRFIARSDRVPRMLLFRAWRVSGFGAGGVSRRRTGLVKPPCEVALARRAGTYGFAVTIAR